MTKTNTNNLKNDLFIQDNIVQERIFNIRGIQVMIDRDLSELYGVETKAINQAVKRNIERFPQDFVFSLHLKRKMNWSQFVTGSKVLNTQVQIHMHIPSMGF